MTKLLHDNNSRGDPDILTPKLQLVAWEMTRSCNLSCAHCRASSTSNSYDDELSTEECFHLVDQLASVGKPIIILTGGEPLMRQDILSIARYAVGHGLRVAMGSNGTLITEEIAAKLKEIPLSRIGISLDFPTAKLQDNFRGQRGAFEATMTGIANARKAGIEIQINSTITKLNAIYLDDLLATALKVGAVAFHPFMLVPTGRGKGLSSVELSSLEYEKTLNWIYDKQLALGNSIFFKPTDAPHYLRVVRQRQKTAPRQKLEANPGHRTMDSISRGCLAGISFCFVSHRGRVQGCGYLDIEAGNIREQDFAHIWAEAALFRHLRDLSHLKGKCSVCEYKRVCGGCRARAYEATGDYLEAEPYCVHQPDLQRRVTIAHG